MLRISSLFLYENDSKDFKIEMRNAFVSVIQNSTWYACQELKGYPTENELNCIAKSMVYYVMTKANVLYENEEIINFTDKNCRICVSDLARIHSSDFVFESMSAKLNENTVKSLVLYRNRLSAAYLFRYKYCCIHEELFLLSWLSQWANISNAINEVSGKFTCQIVTLLDAFRYLESWSD